MYTETSNLLDILDQLGYEKAQAFYPAEEIIKVVYNEVMQRILPQLEKLPILMEDEEERKDTESEILSAVIEGLTKYKPGFSKTPIEFEVTKTKCVNFCLFRAKKAISFLANQIGLVYCISKDGKTEQLSSNEFFKKKKKFEKTNCEIKTTRVQRESTVFGEMEFFIDEDGYKSKINHRR
ncbi:MAG: hypothetical protein ACPLSN_08675 [Dictyoglomus turgidum]